MARTRSQDVSGALLAAAEAVLVEQGPDALTVRAVAEQAGVAPMSVYNRFGSKDGLVDALLTEGFARFGARLQQNQEPDPRARLRACGVAYREFARANPQYYALMFESPALVTGSPELDAAAGQAFGALVENVVIAQGAGLLRAGDPLQHAQMIWSAVHGAVSLELKDRTMGQDPDVWYPLLLDLLIDGLAAAT